MPVGLDFHAALCEDRSWRVLDFVHKLLADQTEPSLSLDAVLTDLAEAIGADNAGLAQTPGGWTIAQSAAGRRDAKATLPWQTQPELLTQATNATLAVLVPCGACETALIAVHTRSDDTGLLVWVEGPLERLWTDAERAALVLVVQVLGRRTCHSDSPPRWTKHLEQALRLRRLEDAAIVTRRLSHDFGNVLTGILGFTELTRAQLTPNDPAYPYVLELCEAVQQGTRMTDHLRLFSRRNAKTGQRSDVASVLAAEEFRLLKAGGSPWVLRIDAAPDLQPVALNAEALQTVLANVLANAREAVKSGGEVTVTARATQLSEADCLDVFGCTEPGAFIEVTVADDGCGLSPEARQRLFAEPFFTDKPRHRGLGLAVVYGILRAYRGALTVEPRAECGILVRLFLPVATVPNRVSPTSDFSTGAVGGERVLIVDDDPMILKLCAATLQKAGYRVQTASTAAEALDSFKAAAREPFRLVVSDVTMPRMTGLDLARRLRREGANVGVVFMSGQGSSGIPEEELADGSIEFLPKPFRPEGLLSAVRSAIERADQRVPAGVNEAD
jgi:signal transduction histidine kinase/ActR/RegA family two-component response regulator